MMQKKPYLINKYAAGAKIYNGTRSMPNIGPVDKLGYRERDAKTKAKRNALLRYMKAHSKGKYASSDWLG